MKTWEGLTREEILEMYGAITSLRPEDDNVISGESSIPHKKRVEASIKAGPILDILKEGWKNRGALKK